MVAAEFQNVLRRFEEGEERLFEVPLQDVIQELDGGRGLLMALPRDGKIGRVDLLGRITQPEQPEESGKRRAETVLDAARQQRSSGMAVRRVAEGLQRRTEFHIVARLAEDLVGDES